MCISADEPAKIDRLIPTPAVHTQVEDATSVVQQQQISLIPVNG